MMTDDRAVLVDTNVLLSATAPLRPLHRAAIAVLNDWPNQGSILATTTQVLREYLVVATRPVEAEPWPAQGSMKPTTGAISRKSIFESFVSTPSAEPARRLRPAADRLRD
jgi:predicted nucleic acid-binding protein